MHSFCSQFVWLCQASICSLLLVLKQNFVGRPTSSRPSDCFWHMYLFVLKAAGPSFASRLDLRLPADDFSD